MGSEEESIERLRSPEFAEVTAPPLLGAARKCLEALELFGTPEWSGMSYNDIVEFAGGTEELALLFYMVVSTCRSNPDTFSLLVEDLESTEELLQLLQGTKEDRENFLREMRDPDGSSTEGGGNGEV